MKLKTITRTAALFSIGTLMLAPAAQRGAVAQLQLHCSGNKLYDSNNVQAILRGCNISGYETNYTGDHVNSSLPVALNTWKSTVVRIPLNQDFWFGYNYSTTPAADGGNSYRVAIDNLVNTAHNANKYIILDLHWSDAGQTPGTNNGQHNMPDDHSTTFWQDVATRYKNNAAVLFDLYNEPHGSNWNQWRNGGTVVDGSFTYHSPGHQGLLNTIRGTGANNIVLAEGQGGGPDLSGIVNGYALSDPQNKIVYESHLYPCAGSTNSQWDSFLSGTPNSYPILIGEWGDDPNGIAFTCVPSPNATTWTNNFLAWLNLHGYNWTAWDMSVNAPPYLITDWNYTPSSYFGVAVKNDLAIHTGGGNTHGGTWGVKATFTTTPTWAPISQAPTGIPTNTSYVASFWLKGGGKVVLRLFNGNYGTEISRITCSATSSWQQFSMNFSTGTNTQVTFDIADGGGVAGTCYIDDCFMGVSGGINKLTNPGFESGNTGWSVSSPFSIVQNP